MRELSNEELLKRIPIKATKNFSEDDIRQIIEAMIPVITSRIDLLHMGGGDEFYREIRARHKQDVQTAVNVFKAYPRGVGDPRVELDYAKVLWFIKHNGGNEPTAKELLGLVKGDIPAIAANDGTPAVGV